MDRRTFLRLGGVGLAVVPLWWYGDDDAAFAALGPDTGTVAPLRPPAVPLAVRGPYTSAWLQGNYSAGTWPSFWTSRVNGMCGLLRVDGHAYLWMGAPSDSTRPPKMTQIALDVTPTRSTFTLTAGGVQLEAEWLSPVEPGQPQLQSIPLALVTVTVKAVDGRHHHVQIYTDITGEWVSGTTEDEIRWSTSTSGSVRTWTVELATPQEFVEHNAMAAWGSALWSTTPIGPGVTYAAGRDATIRDQFIHSGVLGDLVDHDFRPIESNWPVFAFAHDLGVVTGSSRSITFSLGHVRTPVIRYQSRDLAAWWTRYWSSGEAMAAWFIGQAGSARARAITLDARITAAATKAGGADYAALCALALRQAYGACELAVGTDGEPWAFLKEVSSGSYTNTVDVISPAMPVWLYLDPEFLALLLRPLLTYSASSYWKNDWAPHDLGRYPEANTTTGGFEQMPVEETAGMLIMAAAYADRLSAVDAKAWLSPWWSLWSTWAAYLADPTNLPVPPSQLTTDDFAGPVTGSVNLAAKGIVGLGAASLIANRLGYVDQARQWQSTAAQYAQTWLQDSTDPGGAHLDVTEGGTGTWGDLYNAYCDSLLGTGLIPESTASMQAAWYAGHFDRYGLALESTQPAWAKADWMAWTAAWLRSYPVADQIYKGLAAYVSSTAERTPFGDFYDPVTGAVQYNFRARPVVGAMYALLALP